MFQQETNDRHDMASERQTVLGSLQDRRLIEIQGEDAASFLQGLITTDIEKVGESTMMAGALLSPQGKLLFDFLVGKRENNFFLDSPQDVADGLAKRLSLYKLRSHVEIILHDPMAVVIACQPIKTPAQFYFTDARIVGGPAVGRFYLSERSYSSVPHNRQDWDRLRIAQAIAESGEDFTLGDVFPHDINLDQIGGLSFKKGCYIGQEVVSRMQHRGTARRRLLLANAQTDLPASGSVIEAGAKPIGTLGSSLDGQGLALVRLDRVKNALDKAIPIIAGGVELKLAIPQRVHFSYPETISES